MIRNFLYLNRNRIKESIFSQKLTYFKKEFGEPSISRVTHLCSKSNIILLYSIFLCRELLKYYKGFVEESKNLLQTQSMLIYLVGWSVFLKIYFMYLRYDQWEVSSEDILSKCLSLSPWYQFLLLPRQVGCEDEAPFS